MTSATISCVKMLMREQIILEKNPVEGTIMIFNEEDIQNSKFIIFGTKGTPHQGSFLMFKIHYGTNYPYKEPKVVIINQKHRTHPNLYVSGVGGGKVCVSILGTWGKNNWSAALKTRGVLVSIQSLLIDNPIKQEPGYSDIEESWKDSPIDEKKERYKIMKEYNIISSYYALKDTAFHVLLHGVLGFEEFQEEVINYFRNNWRDYQSQVEYFKPLHGQVFSKNCYGLSAKINYPDLKHDFETICSKYGIDPNQPEEDEVEEVANEDSVVSQEVNCTVDVRDEKKANGKAKGKSKEKIKITLKITKKKK